MTGISCLFDASAVVFLLFQVMYFQAGVSRRNLFFGFIVLACSVFVPLICLWFKHEKEFRACQRELEKPGPGASPAGAEAEKEAEVPDEETRALKLPTTVTSPSCPHYIRHLSIWQQFKTYPFIFIVSVALIHSTRSNTYLGIAQDHLASLGDVPPDYLYLSIFMLALPFSFVFVLPIGWTVKRFGFTNAWHVVNCLGLIQGITSCLPNLEVQVVTAVVYTAYRAYYYSIVAAFLPYKFGSRTVGRILGTVFLCTAFTNLLQYPLVKMTNDSLGGDFTPLNVGLTCLCLLSIPLIEGLRHWEAKHSLCVASSGQHPQSANSEADGGGSGDGLLCEQLTAVAAKADSQAGVQD
eukprot:CAMPEP_0175127178 /NCGR_PEP_ID=MMETSP0087-20121206/4254_1 /TAXON_ID=136419 /ORGANISM="Unknown Unknown, Strain D1" /LENGTH=351 /DNA_ID=CAMNT_0016409151 /DNA_START=342 /DNA_END=1397 /DNA_ORIENTATION=-